MESEQFSLCWDNFHKNMSSGMHSLLENEDLVDVTLAIEGQLIKAHKMVLSVCSPYFRNLFNSNPCQHPIVFLKDVSYLVMNDLLTFMYQGEVQVNQENLGTFIKTAEALQIKGLTADNNEEEIVETDVRFGKRQAVDETKVKNVKRFTAGPAPKRTKVNNVTSPTPSSSYVPTSTPATNVPKVNKEEIVEPPSTESIMQFKMEPYENAIEQPETAFIDESAAYETMDETVGDEDYSLIETGDEPKPGTSGEGGDAQEVKAVKASGYYYKGKRKPEMPRYIVDGFVFHVNIIKGTPPMTYLRCLEYKRLGCHARAVIPFNGTVNDIKLKKAHNHPPDYAAEEKIVFMRELKAFIVKNEKVSVKEVYDLLSPLYPNAARATSYASIKGKMNRWRRLSDSNQSTSSLLSDY